jgi:hypothetical protein
MEIVQDGINAQRYGSDYQLANQEVSPSDVLKVQMSAGGGWVAILIPMD